MSDSGMAQFVELLSVARASTDLDAHEKRPVVILSIRPEPDRNWRFHHLSLSITQAERLRDDLTSLLRAPTTFLLIATLALATGCSAKVEVVNEKSAAVEADSAAAPPASAKHRTAVEVDFFGQQQPEPVIPKVANDQRATTPKAVPVNTSGIQVNGNENEIEFHYHRHRRSRSPVIVYPIVRHEMVIVPSDGSAPVVFMDNAPPRITLVDEQVARAYAEHMLRLAESEGHR